jgi:hypothetical protein
VVNIPTNNNEEEDRAHGKHLHFNQKLEKKQGDHQIGLHWALEVREQGLNEEIGWERKNNFAKVRKPMK